MIRPGTIGWLALHEARLSWRDWLYLITGGTAGGPSPRGGLYRLRGVPHGLAYLMLGSSAKLAGMADTQVLLVITGSLAMSGPDAVAGARIGDARVLCAGDLDLILASPVSAWRLFAVRIMAMRWPSRPRGWCWPRRCQRAGLARRRALARRLRGDRGAGDGRGRSFGCDHRRAVPHDRPAADAGRRAGARSDHRRRVPSSALSSRQSSRSGRCRGRRRCNRRSWPNSRPDVGSIFWWPAAPSLRAAGADRSLWSQHHRTGRHDCRLCARASTARAGRGLRSARHN